MGSGGRSVATTKTEKVRARAFLIGSRPYEFL